MVLRRLTFNMSLQGAAKLQGSNLLLLLSILLCLLPAQAEDLKIKLKGAELKKIAAFEIKLDYEPKETFVLEDSFTIYASSGADSSLKELAATDFLFKTVDVDNSLIRVFLAKPLVDNEVLIKAKLKRSNYSGRATAKIAGINFISEFSQEVDASRINSSLELIENEEPLPYMGITKAEILGPHERIFAKDMFISISNVETYGFTFNKSIKHPRINGQEAKFINDKIIAVNLKLDPLLQRDKLDVTLELDVDGQTISKKVGTIEFIEAIK